LPVTPLPIDAAGLPDDVAAELKLLQEEVGLLRERLGTAPDRIRALESSLDDVRGRLDEAQGRNARLAATLQAARGQLTELRAQVERLTAPPRAYATFLGASEDGEHATVMAAGRKLEVATGPGIDLAVLHAGQEVQLNDASTIVAVGGFGDRGELMTVAELLEDGRALVVGPGEGERIVHVAGPVRTAALRAGDSVLVDLRADTVVERVERSEADRLVLEQVPDITYESIGGLGDQISVLRDAIELPYLHGDLYREYEVRAPKGVLLYGPPGCGKTMIAKAVANALAQRVRERTGREDVRAFFLNVKGPELLNKYVGETERQIRLIFQRAREKSAEGMPVIVFFDEMESLFRTRGSGVSTDVETTIVPQLLAEIDGVESLKDVIVIGASNREDMIDPALLRAGRLDVKIKVERPDERAAAEILSIYLHERLPLDEETLVASGGDARVVVDTLVAHTVGLVYATDATTEFLEVTYAGGDKEVLHFRDFSSGAMLENIVGRAKTAAIKRAIAGGPRGLRAEDLTGAVRDEFRENEDLPNTTNPDDWARISGKKGERIVYVRTLVGDGSLSGRAIETLNPGQYL
jgi:proteasome-associated ATPase